MIEPHMGRLILVRHGESEGNATRTFTHSPSVALTERGRDQALTAAKRIAESFRPQRLISSPFARARQTALIIGAHLGLPIEIEEEFREQSLGLLAGKSYDLVLQDATFDRRRPWEWRPPEGESLDDVRARVAPVFDRLARASRGQEVVVVSHAGVMQSICAHLTETWRDAPIPGNAEVLVVELNGEWYSEPRRLPAT
jgi:probable phosphoglycerate mutase